MAAIPPGELNDVLRSTLQREALLYAKAEFESRAPELFVETAEKERKVTSLAQLSTELLEPILDHVADCLWEIPHLQEKVWRRLIHQLR